MAATYVPHQYFAHEVTILIVLSIIVLFGLLLLIIDNADLPASHAEALERNRCRHRYIAERQTDYSAASNSMPRSSGDTTQDSGSAFDEDTDRNEQQQTTKLNNSIESENTSMVKSQQVPNISGCVVSNDSCMSKKQTNR